MGSSCADTGRETRREIVFDLYVCFVETSVPSSTRDQDRPNRMQAKTMRKFGQENIERNK